MMLVHPHEALQRSGERSEEHTSELQSHHDLVCRLLLEKKNIARSFCLEENITSQCEHSLTLRRSSDELRSADLLRPCLVVTRRSTHHLYHNYQVATNQS